MKTREEKIAYTREWTKKNPDKVKEQNRKKYAKDKLENPERILRKREKSKEWFQNNREQHREYQREWSKNKLSDIKEKIFDKLGHCCSKCGFNDKRALCIDHVNGGGFKELNSGLSVFSYYKKVLSDVHNTYQILCHNCNWIKRHENNEVRKPEA
jgi:hypothetical protein